MKRANRLIRKADREGLAEIGFQEESLTSSLSPIGAAASVSLITPWRLPQGHQRLRCSTGTDLDFPFCWRLAQTH